MSAFLVTGGLGFIGHHVAKELLRQGNRVVIVDNFSNANMGLVDELEKTQQTEKDVLLYKLDIRNSKRLTEIFSRERIETCIHLGAKISVNDSITQPHETLDVNITGTLNVLEACCYSNVSNFVFASSAAVYGNPKTLPISEEHVIRPISPYGASKAAGEALVSSYRSRIKNCIILRFFNVYGSGQTYTYAGVITKFIERLSNGLPPIIYGSGNQTRDFVQVSDVVKAIILAQENKPDKCDMTDITDTFNIGTGNPTSIEQLADMLIDIFGLKEKIRPVYSQSVAGDIMHSYADIQKAKEKLMFFPKQELKKGLMEQQFP